MNDKILFFITDNYPFGYGETFIENEIDYLSQNFKGIFIISKNINDSQTRKVPKNCKVYRILKDYKELFKILLDKYYLCDLINNFNFKKLKKMIGFQFYSKLIENKVLEIIKKYNLKKENIILYSYWFYNGAYAGGNLKKRNIIKKAISRAHGYDLYLERGYQPFKKEILERIDMIYPCSKKGERYLKKLYKKENIKYSYLGTINNFLNKKIEKIDNADIKIVSCSNLISLKRVELIINSLKKLEERNDRDKNIEWIHFGDGIEKNKLKDYAKNNLKKINFNFKGRLENKEILKFYFKNNIKFFIHLSSTEGLPVSMMEVQSFGIPIIATNVGGVNEIVNEKTGILLSANPTILEIIDGIEKILNMSKNEYDEYRINSYINWHENFNEKKNYKDFVMELFDENKKI